MSGNTRKRPQSSVPPSPRLEAPVPSGWALSPRHPRPGPQGRLGGGMCKHWEGKPPAQPPIGTPLFKLNSDFLFVCLFAARQCEKFGSLARVCQGWKVSSVHHLMWHLPPVGRLSLSLGGGRGGECHHAVPSPENTTFKSFAHLTYGFISRYISLHFPL